MMSWWGKVYGKGFLKGNKALIITPHAHFKFGLKLTTRRPDCPLTIIQQDNEWFPVNNIWHIWPSTSELWEKNRSISLEKSERWEKRQTSLQQEKKGFQTWKIDSKMPVCQSVVWCDKSPSLFLSFGQRIECLFEQIRSFGHVLIKVRILSYFTRVLSREFDARLPQGWCVSHISIREQSTHCVDWNLLQQILFTSDLEAHHIKAVSMCDYCATKKESE